MKESERAKKVQQLQDAVYGGGRRCRTGCQTVGIWTRPLVLCGAPLKSDQPDQLRFFTSVFYFRVAKGTKDKEWAVVIIGLMYLKK